MDRLTPDAFECAEGAFQRRREFLPTPVTNMKFMPISVARAPAHVSPYVTCIRCPPSTLDYDKRALDVDARKALSEGGNRRLMRAAAVPFAPSQRRSDAEFSSPPHAPPPRNQAVHASLYVTGREDMPLFEEKALPRRYHDGRAAPIMSRLSAPACRPPHRREAFRQEMRQTLREQAAASAMLPPGEIARCVTSPSSSSATAR